MAFSADLASPAGLSSSAVEKSKIRDIFTIFSNLFDAWEGILIVDYKVCIEVQPINPNLNQYPNSDHNLTQTVALTF